MRLAILTGGSRGIGRALVHQLQAQGYSLIEFSRSAPYAFSHALDLSDPITARECIHAALTPVAAAQISRLLVIGNAGVIEPVGPAACQAPGAVLANLNAGFVSAILFFNEVIARFQDLDCPKQLVSISSGAASKGYAGWSLYCAVKAGLENYIRSLALEQAAMVHPFVAVNILPGVVDTGMQVSIRAATEADFPSRGRFIRFHEEGQLASADEVAKRICAILAREDLQSGMRYDVREMPGEVRS